MAFFGFGAFSTPVGSLIEQATDNSASAGNLALHLQICDTINDSDSGPKEAVAAIRKRLTGNSKNFHIINLTLTVLETCVKNCGFRLQSKIAQRDFLSDLMKVIAVKNNPPTIVKERILGLIQYWADAFAGKPQLATVGELYEQLKADGVEFPPIDLDNLAPVETSGRGGLQLTQPSAPAEGSPVVPRPQQQRPQQQGTPPPRQSRRPPSGPLRPEQVAKLLSELDIVRKNMDIMNEIMTENEPGKESADDTQLLEDLNRIVHSMQTRVGGLIETCSNEIILESTLVINDDLNTLFVRYDRWLKNAAAAKTTSPPPSTGYTVVTSSGVATTSLTEPVATSNISYPRLDEPPSYDTTEQLIDLGGDPAPPTASGDDIVNQLAQLGITSDTVPAQTTPTVQETTPTDDFDMFAKSRTAYSQAGSTYADNLLDQNISLSAAVHGRQDEQEQPSEQHPYANLTDWLEQKPEGQVSTAPPPTTGESATSAEFDQFLAQRATKGEGLPAARPRPQMQKEEERSDELFQL